MLAAKTTVKDRWRQVLNEANRIETKHLLTLQEGVPEGQFTEMQDAKVNLSFLRTCTSHTPSQCALFDDAGELPIWAKLLIRLSRDA
jgi:hypothetical protein